MNRQGGYGPVGFIILLIFLIPMWAFVFAPRFTLAGQNAIASGETGLGAFLWMNINLLFFIILVIVAAAYLALGGNE